jgi:hypothetical protein
LQISPQSLATYSITIMKFFTFKEHLKLILVSDELSSAIRGLDALIAVSKVVAPSCKTLVIIETEVSFYQSNKDFWKKATNFSNESIHIKRYGLGSTG